ncbi:MAG: hypothetical protein R3F43_14620 [bacterium]
MPKAPEAIVDDVPTVVTDPPFGEDDADELASDLLESAADPPAVSPAAVPAPPPPPPTEVEAVAARRAGHDRRGALGVGRPGPLHHRRRAGGLLHPVARCLSPGARGRCSRPGRLQRGRRRRPRCTPGLQAACPARAAPPRSRSAMKTGRSVPAAVRPGPTRSA